MASRQPATRSTATTRPAGRITRPLGRTTRSVGRRPTPGPTIDYQRLPDGSAVVVDSTTGATYALNATGADLWELCDGQHTEAAIVTALLERYAATRAQLRPAVTSLLDQWRALDLLEAR